MAASVARPGWYRKRPRLLAVPALPLLAAYSCLYWDESVRFVHWSAQPPQHGPVFWAAAVGVAVISGWAGTAWVAEASFDAVPVELGRRVADRLGGASSTTLPAPGDLARAGRLEPALREVIESERLDAITVRCFDCLGSIETSGCVALAQLNDAGVVELRQRDAPGRLDRAEAVEAPHRDRIEALAFDDLAQRRFEPARPGQVTRRRQGRR